MLIIPGWLIAIATFPGIIVHEAGHLLFCRLRNVAVLEVCFLRFANPPGYVIHERAKDFTSSFLIAIGPFLLNTVLCLVICFPSFLRVRVFGLGDPMSYLLLWLGVSVGMHAFPSTQDAEILRQEAAQAARRLNVLAIIAYPVSLLIYFANALRFIWFDYFYGIAIGILLPEILLRNAL